MKNIYAVKNELNSLISERIEMLDRLDINDEDYDYISGSLDAYQICLNMVQKAIDNEP